MSGTAAGAGGALAAEASAAPTDAFRIVDGRSTGLPGWTVDRYGPALLVQCFTPGGAAPEMLAQMLEIPAVLSLREPARVPIVLKERGARGAPGAGAGPDGRLVEGPPLPGALHPPASDDPLAARAGRVVVREDGVRYGCDLLHGQNTGIFLDARPLRSWVRAHAAGRRVLNLFSYTSAFGVVAALGGARSTTNVDVVPGALERGRVNYALNGLPADPRSHLRAEVFEFLARAARGGERWDALIVDPPPVPTGGGGGRRRGGRQRGFDPYRDMGRLLGRCLDLLAPGGWLLAVSAAKGREGFEDQLPAAAAAWRPLERDPSFPGEREQGMRAYVLTPPPPS